MTRKWGRSYDAWLEALKLRQMLRGGDGKTCERCGKREDKRGRTDLIIAHPEGYDAKKAPCLDDLALWHQSCNIEADPPNQGPRLVPPQRERREGEPAPMLTGSQSEKSGIMRERWLYWINDMEKGPFAQHPVLAVKMLVAWAPRALARSSLGETSLGVAQSYEDYVLMDSDNVGGPLHVFTPRQGKLSGVLCVEYVTPGRDQPEERSAVMEAVKA